MRCRKTLKELKPTDMMSSQLPSEADAVVIGGGVTGCSTLFHLASLGLKNVVLLEKYQLTAGLPFSLFTY